MKGQPPYGGYPLIFGRRVFGIEGQVISACQFARPKKCFGGTPMLQGSVSEIGHVTDQIFAVNSTVGIGTSPSRHAPMPLPPGLGACLPAWLLLLG